MKAPMGSHFLAHGINTNSIARRASSSLIRLGVHIGATVLYVVPDVLQITIVRMITILSDVLAKSARSTLRLK